MDPVKFRSLSADLILGTIQTLRRRIGERFPQANLVGVAAEVEQVAQQARERAEWIGRPNIPLRATIGLLLLFVLVVLSLALTQLSLRIRVDSFAELVQAIESGVNDLIFLGLGIFFLVRLEVRAKRQRALKAIHELRSLAHVIDMHQLTKDPHSMAHPDRATASSPRQTLSSYELCRYLDYCSELLALLGKVAALYVQHLDDPVILAAVDEIEDLTTGISRKIWQKITLIQASRNGSEAQSEVTATPECA